MCKSLKQIREKLFEESGNIIDEAQQLIDFVLQNDDIPFSSTDLDCYLQNAYPQFFLFEEQKYDPELLIKATRFYTNEKGENVFFFSSSQAHKILPICRKAVDKYFNNHSVSLKMHRDYCILKFLTITQYH